MKKKRTPIPSPSPKSKSDLGEGSRDYNVGTWAGQLQLKCKLCAFDTLAGEAAMLTHLVEAHGSEVALDALFPNRAQAAPGETVRLQEPAKADIEGIPEGDPARGVYEIDLKEVDNAKNNSD